MSPNNEISPLRRIWEQIGVDSLAAGIAMVPVFPALMLKSAQQQQIRMHSNMREIVQQSLMGAPYVAAAVGIQLYTQRQCQDFLVEHYQLEKKHPMTTLLSCMAVGIASCPLLAIMNGLTTKTPPLESLHGLRPWPVVAIIGRETTFVLSLKVNGMVGPLVKDRLGDSELADRVTAFLSGAVMSALNHPADTALTRWQKNLSMRDPRVWMRGSLVRSIAIGVFCATHAEVAKKLQTL